MRIIAVAALFTVLALPAQAQQVNTIKASGANAAGACAGSFEILAQGTCRAPNPDLRRLAAYTKAREFFATMPQFAASDIQQAGQTFITLMSTRMRDAKTPEIREDIQRELLDLANKCLVSTNYDLKLTQEVAYCSAAPAAPVAPLETQPLVTQPLITQPLQTEPLPTQPLETLPYVTQPYELEPLVLDPIVPVQ